MNHKFFKQYTHEQLKRYTHEQMSYTYWFVFVYDRTKEDVLRAAELNGKYLNLTITAEERDEWLAGIKGALNAADLQRIEWNTRLIGDFELIKLHFEVKTWKHKDIPRVSDFIRILENVHRIRETGFKLPGTPEVPKQPLTDYESWNDIEKILHDATLMCVLNEKGISYCGEEFTGERIGVL